MQFRYEIEKQSKQLLTASPWCCYFGTTNWILVFHCWHLCSQEWFMLFFFFNTVEISDQWILSGKTVTHSIILLWENPRPPSVNLNRWVPCAIRHRVESWDVEVLPKVSNCTCGVALWGSLCTEFSLLIR